LFFFLFSPVVALFPGKAGTMFPPLPRIVLFSGVITPCSLAPRCQISFFSFVLEREALFRRMFYPCLTRCRQTVPPRPFQKPSVNNDPFAGVFLFFLGDIVSLTSTALCSVRSSSTYGYFPVTLRKAFWRRLLFPIFKFFRGTFPPPRFFSVKRGFFFLSSFLSPSILARLHPPSPHLFSA